MYVQEIDPLADFDWDCGTYYEVELWSNGDCDSRYFKTKAAAIRCMRKCSENENDCIKYHYGGECSLFMEKDKIPK